MVNATSAPTSRIGRIKVVVFCLSMMGMAALAIIPSYASIAQTFKASNTMVQMLTSLPNLTMMLAGLSIGKLTQGRFSNKTVAVGAIALIVIGGLLPLAFHTSMGLLLIFSALVGFGQGLTTNLVQVLITNELPDDQREGTMGQSTTFTNIGGMIFMSGGGWLGAHYWVNNYWIYVVPAIVLVIVLVTLPNDPPVRSATTTTTRQPLSRFVWWVILLAFFSMMLNNVLNNNISMFIAQHHFGSTAVAGYAGTVGLLGGMLCGLLVGALAKVAKRYTIVISFALCAAAFLLIGMGNSLATAFIGAFLNGASFSIAMAQYPYLISLVTNRQSVAVAIGFYTALYSVGGVVSPIVMNPLAKFAGNGSLMNIFTVTGGLALVMAVIVLVTGFQRRLIASVESV